MGSTSIKHSVLNVCESGGSSCFKLGEGLRRGLLRDYEPSDGPSFQALEFTHLVSG